MQWTLLFLLVCLPALCQSKIDDGTDRVVKRKNNETSEYPRTAKTQDDVNNRKLYTEMFKLRRKEHKEAVQSLMVIDKSEMEPVLKDLQKNMKKILLESREIVERADLKPQDPFPEENETQREALSKVLENLSLWSELSLRFPKSFKKALEKDIKLNTVIVWTYNYSIETGLLDEDTLEVVNSMAQQLEIIPRDENFINTLDKEGTKERLEELKLKAEDERREKKEGKHTDKKIKTVNEEL